MARPDRTLLDATAPLDEEIVPERSPPAYQRGDLVARRYRIDHLLARGGMSDVYAATDRGLTRAIALKVAAGNSTGAAVSSERLLREARMLEGLRHPNIVAVHDHGRTVRGTAFIVLERVEGLTLRQTLSQQGALPWQTAATIAGQIASALDAVHARGFVHCDLSPSNVLIAHSASGEPLCKVIDFGIASRNGKARSVPSHGTRSYVAPEGLVDGKADVRLDLYALGVMLAEMLGDSAKGAPPALIELTNSLRAAEPASRPASASAVIEILRRITASDIPSPPPVRPPPRVPAPTGLAWSVIGTALLLSAGALISAVAVSRAPSTVVAAEVGPPPPPVRAELQALPAKVAMPAITLTGATEWKQVTRPASTHRELEAALLERRRQLSGAGIDTDDVVAVSGISFDPSRRSARVVYRRENPNDELVEYWALRDGRWQPQ